MFCPVGRPSNRHSAEVIRQVELPVVDDFEHAVGREQLYRRVEQFRENPVSGVSRRVTEDPVERPFDAPGAVRRDDSPADPRRSEAAAGTPRSPAVVVGQRDLRVGSQGGVDARGAVARAEIEHPLAVRDAGRLEEQPCAGVEFVRREQPRQRKKVEIHPVDCRPEPRRDGWSGRVDRFGPFGPEDGPVAAVVDGCRRRAEPFERPLVAPLPGSVGGREQEAAAGSERGEPGGDPGLTDSDRRRPRGCVGHRVDRQGGGLVVERQRHGGVDTVFGRVPLAESSRTGAVVGHPNRLRGVSEPDPDDAVVRAQTP